MEGHNRNSDTGQLACPRAGSVQAAHARLDLICEPRGELDHKAFCPAWLKAEDNMHHANQLAVIS
jgi:hypothetical protein